MTTITLLPPDPTLDAHYWINHVEFGAIPVRWDAAGQFWENGFDAAHMGNLGCTLASPHPIPGPAALEAVYGVVETLLDVANLSVITPQDEIHVGPVIYAASGAQVKALRDAAAMLRAALETKESGT